MMKASDDDLSRVTALLAKQGNATAHFGHS